MKPHETTDRRVDHLVERLKDDALSESELAEVRDIIRNQPQARRRMVRLLYLAADLRDVVGNWHGRMVSKPNVPIMQRAVWTAVGGLAATAAVFLLVMQPWNRVGPEVGGATGGVVEAAAHDPDSDAIAVIARVRDPKWMEGTTIPESQLEQGALVGAGTLEIESGLVQIDFYSGATVIVEGPAKFGIVESGRGSLEHGNLWAHVPPPARGFQIESGVFNVVDLGTEFGMKIRPDGTGEVHVLDGEVKVVSEKAGTKRERMIEKGHGAVLLADGGSHEIPARPEMFAISGKLDVEEMERFSKWQDFQTTLRKDPDLLIDYDFQDLSLWGRTLPNMAEYGPSDTNGAIVGCGVTEGRWLGKGALEFRNSSHRVRVNVPGRYDSLTLACWVRLDAQKSAEMALLHPETNQEFFVHWGLVNIQGGGMHVHFAHSFPDEDGEELRRHYHCDWNLLRNGSLGKWMHLAVVFDNAAGRISHYQNGELIGVSEIVDKKPLGIGISDIGNWPSHEWAKGTIWEVRILIGAIDEFLILKRAWSQDEVRAHAELGGDL